VPVPTWLTLSMTESFTRRNLGQRGCGA
jgi:hypothetical protein